MLTDLVNAHKHTGYPLRTPRSNLDPVINNVMECLAQRKDYTGMDYGYTLSPDTGESRLGVGSHIIIDAEIYDKHNNKIFDIDELIEESIAVWQSIIIDNNLLA